MKNRDIRKILLISVSAFTITSMAAPILAEGELASQVETAPVVDPVSEETEEVPVPSVIPAVTEIPAEPQVTDIPEQEPEDPEIPDVSPSITPAVSPLPTEEPQPGVSPTPTDTPTPTPTPILPEAVQKIIDEIKKLEELAEITLDQKASIEEIRKEYDLLSEEDKKLVTNYESFEKIEKTLKELLDAEALNSGEDAAAQIGTPVYYTNMVSNLHAGKEFYLSSLKDHYQLSFSEDFASVMEQIEKEYKEEYKLYDHSDLANSLISSSADAFLVRNWQDILAVYVYRHSQAGETSFYLSGESKAELEEIFALLNPVIRDKSDITKVYYANYNVHDYVLMNRISEKGQLILNKYLENDCKLLCAVVTAGKGFVRQSVGKQVSEERVNVITAAYSLIGKVGYFYGGKSLMLGEDPSWGNAEKVVAEGSTSTGTIRAYGLDCSGFVTWAVVNGYQDLGMEFSVGEGTSEQWDRANVVSEADAQPGDLVFEDGPQAIGADNHVGILCGKTSSGDWIAVHCSSSKNGVTVGEAYGASFRYIRQPDFFPSETELEQIRPDLPEIHLTEEETDTGSVNQDTESFEADVPETDVPEESLSEENVPEETSLQDDSVVELFDDVVLIDTSKVEPFDPVVLVDNSTVEPFEMEEPSDGTAADAPEDQSEDEILVSLPDLFYKNEFIGEELTEIVNEEMLVDDSVVEPF